VSDVLLVRLDLLGDVAFSLSAARAVKLRWPSARVTMLTLPQTADLAGASEDVDEVISIDTNLLRSPATLFKRETLRNLASSIRKLRSRRFDAVVSLYGRTSSLLALMARAAIRIGYRDEAYPSGLDVRLPDGRFSQAQRRHDTELGLRLVQALPDYGPGGLPHRGVGTENVPAPRIRVSRTDEIAGMLRAYGISTTSPLVVLHAGSGYGEFKRWPVRNFCDLAERVSAFGVSTVVTGAAGDAAVARRIVGSSSAVSFAGETSMPQLIALLRRADVVVSGDSGPLHVAAALGTPVVGIYGPTDPLVNGPLPWHGQPVAVLRRDIACSPCYSVESRAECPLGHNICMDLVTVDEVASAVLAILRGTRKIALASSVETSGGLEKTSP